MLKKNDELLIMKNKAERFITSLPKKLQSNSLYSQYIRIMGNYINSQLLSFNIKEALTCSAEVKTRIEKYGNTDAFMAFYYNYFMSKSFLKSFNE